MTVRRDVRRRIDQYVANPSCEANVLSAVHDVPMEQVARLFGMHVEVGQSPFAIARGATFEKSLFEHDAQRLRKALVDASVLPPNSSGFLDFRLTTNRGPTKSLEVAQSESVPQGFNPVVADRIACVATILSRSLPGLN